MAAFVTVVEFSDKRRSKQILSSSTSIFTKKKIVKFINYLTVVSIYISNYLYVTNTIWTIFKQFTLVFFFFFQIFWLWLDLFSRSLFIFYSTPEEHVMWDPSKICKFSTNHSICEKVIRHLVIKDVVGAGKSSH